MFPILQIGHLAIQTPGLFLLIGLYLGLSLMERYLDRYGLQGGDMYTLVFGALISAAVGGRLTYAAQNLPAFFASPASLVALNLTLWDATGGVILGLGFSVWYAIHKKMKLWPLLDSLSPLLAVMMIAIGLAQLAAGSAYGAPARLPWSIYLWGAWRQPSQIYETIGAIFVLGWVLKRLSKTRDGFLPKPAPGGLFWEFVAWTAALRLFLEAFRGDSPLLTGQFRTAQVLAWLVLAVSLWMLGKKSNIHTIST